VGIASGQLGAQGLCDLPQRGHDRREPAGQRRSAVAAGRPAERGRGREPFGQQRPGRLAVRQQVADLVEQLEARARGLSLVTGAGRKRGDHVGERRQHPDHQPDGGVGQDLQLRIGLLGVREVTREDLQQDLLAHVEEVDDTGRQRVGDQRHLDVALRRPDIGRDHRPDRVEPGVAVAPAQVLVEDAHELPEMRFAPVPAQALALRQDRVNRLLGGGQAGDGDQLGPAELFGRGLRPRRPDEQPLLPVLLGQVRETGLDRPVQVSHRGEVLRPGNDVGRAHQRLGPADGG